MAETKKGKVPPERLARHLRPSEELLFALLEEANVLLATDRGLFGWPGLSGKMFPGLQVVADHAYLNQIDELEFAGPVKLKTPAQFFDCIGQDSGDFQVWGLCRPKADEGWCRWTTARISTDNSGKVTVRTSHHQSGRDIVKVTGANPLNMLIALHEFMEKVCEYHERDARKAAVMMGTLSCQCRLFVRAIEAVYLGESTAPSHTRATLEDADKLSPGLLEKSPFKLDKEVAKKMAEARGRD